MTRIITILTLLLAMAFDSQAFASPLMRTGWLFTSPDAVAANYTSFCQDRSGFLWIGSDRGLLRFEGNSYDIYTSNPSDPTSISDSSILSLLCDSKGRIWIGTTNGLNRYDPATDTFSVIKLPNLLFGGYIISIAEQPDGTITFLCSGVGLYVLGEEKGDYVAIKYAPALIYEKQFNYMVCTSDGFIYSSTNTGLLCAMRPNGQMNTYQISNDYIQDLVIETNETLLLADRSKVYRFNRKTHEVTELSNTRSVIINTLSRGKRGETYICTDGEGLWRVMPTDTTLTPCADIYSPFLNLSKSSIGAAYTSDEGNLWMGCNYYGLVMVAPQPLPFLYRRLTDAFPDFGGGITALAIWKGHEIVSLGKGGIGVFAPDGRLLHHVTVPGGNPVCSFRVIEGDKVLVGVANDGVWELDLPDGNLRKVVGIEGKYPNIVMIPGNGDELMIAMHGFGVVIYNRATGQMRNIEVKSGTDLLTNSFVISMERSVDDKIWLGIYSGLACYDLKGDSLVPVVQGPFLPGASYSIAPRKDSTLLVGTSHGLIEFDPATGDVKKFTQADGLVDNTIHSLVVDNKGGEWIGTMQGLSYRDPATGEFVSFHGGYGLVETQFPNMALSTQDNRVHMASNLGLTSFSPDAALTPGFNTSVKISGIYMNGKRISPQTKFGNRYLVEGDPMTPKSLHLPYQENAMTLRLTTMDFRDASNVRYAWKVDGLEEGWTEMRPGDAMVYLPHLDPGKYKLHLRAMENGISSEPLVIDIHISAPWYLSWWAQLIYLAILVALVLLLLMVWKKRRYEHEAEERIKFFMDVSHDIRSPITLILSPLESLLKRPLDDDVRAKLEIMSRNARRILSLVNQLLEIRKLEKGKMRLKCRLTDLNDFVKELVDMFRPQAQEKKQTLEFTAGENVPEVWVDRSNFDKILVNLISNAIKYTPEGGKIDVTVGVVTSEEGEEWVEVKVTDTGIGLDPKSEDHLFERFYQADGHNGKGGFGIGLDLCRRLVDFHHGRISGHNRRDGVKGSVFSVMLPVDSSSYASDELMLENAPGESLNRYVILPTSPSESSQLPKTNPHGRIYSMLVVDDDTELREYICSHFSKRFKVKGAADGGEALKIVATSQPDIIVSDVLMPGVDGLTMLRRLKGNADTHHIPVVLLSSKQDVADRMAGWDRGADGYLGKPFHVEELERVVDTLIDNRLRMKGKFSGAQDTAPAPAEEPKSGDTQLIEKIVKVIETSIEDTGFNVEELSNKMGLSRAHLHRKMKDNVGMTPSDFIRTVRMRRACELMRAGKVPVTLVAYKVGFTSQSHFSTQFKNFTGFTPSEYRAKCEAERNKEAEEEKKADA